MSGYAWKATALRSVTVSLSLALVVWTLSDVAYGAENVTPLFYFDYADGIFPFGALIQGTDGYIYGTTSQLGSSDACNGTCDGTIFKFNIASQVLTTLYTFTGPDGGAPYGGLVQASDGNFYGTTQYGGLTDGEFGYGTVFKIDSSGNLTTLYVFSGGHDGAFPRAGLVMGSDGNFYGTTSAGGDGTQGAGDGTVFVITTSGALSTLHKFTGGSDGATPEAGLVQGSDGNFYGTTEFGGTAAGQAGFGAVFKITLSGSLTALHTFTDGADGGNPAAALTPGSDGNLYGTTAGGGLIGGATAYGTVFKVTPSGTFTTLYTFTGASDGSEPAADLLAASDGNFYGTTSGTLFRMTQSGTLTTLYAFPYATGQVPTGRLLAASDGNFYGTMSIGGPNGLGNLYFVGPQTLTVSLVDPVPTLVNGSGILTNAATLASSTQTVNGVAADGTTQIVVRIAAPSAGIPIQLTLEDEEGTQAVPGDGPALGYLTTLLAADGTGSTEGGTPITVTSVAVPNGTSMAFAVYHVPIDFVRDTDPADGGLAMRKVSVLAQAGLSEVTKSLQVVRPPAVFVHGIWGDLTDGADIEAALQSQDIGLTISDAGYAANVTIISSSPSYGANYVASGNNLGFKFGAITALRKISNAIGQYRTNNPLSLPIAVSAADVVAHSMGGAVVRTMPLISGFSSPLNFNAGPIHKLITIGTPHVGSPLALQLMQSTSACTRKILLREHKYAFTSAKTNLGTFPGGAGDLQGDLSGTPASLSAALTAIQPATTTTAVGIPTGLIVGSMSAAQLATVDSDWHARIIRTVCSSDPLASALTSSAWPTIVGQQSDAIVPVSSQLAGNGTSEFPFAVAVHSPGAEALGFATGTPPGPTELEASSGVPGEVLQLLNTPVSNTVFMPLP